MASSTFLEIVLSILELHVRDGNGVRNCGVVSGPANVTPFTPEYKGASGPTSAQQLLPAQSRPHLPPLLAVLNVLASRPYGDLRGSIAFETVVVVGIVSFSRRGRKYPVL